MIRTDMKAMEDRIKSTLGHVTWKMPDTSEDYAPVFPTPGVYKSAIPVTTYSTGSTKEEVITQLVQHGLHIYATGSRVTTNFDPRASDYDYVVLDDELWSWHDSYTNCDMWMSGESGNQYSEFQSLKKQMVGSDEVVNLIFVRTKEMFTKYCMASDLIRKVNPKTKKERVELFDIIFKQSIPF